MFKKFRPTFSIGSIYDFDFEALKAEGFRLLLFDIDNTLVADNAPATDKSDALLTRLIDMGFKVAVISNNYEERCEKFCKKSGAAFYSMAMKPSTKCYIKAMYDMGVSLKETAAFGDQLFTDIAGANKSGIRSYLVAPLDLVNERMHIKIKRKPELLIKKLLKI